MRTNIFTTCFMLFFVLFCSAQVNEEEVLFTVGDSPVLASEFLRVYNKNLNLVKDESQKDVDEYLSLFINYKLKLIEARALDFHKKPTYIRELEGYKKQLAKNYLTNHEVTDALVKEAYERISYDVKAKHILIRLDAGQKDTLDVYNRLLKLRERFINEDFDKLQKELHNGNSIFVEDLGYFSGFKMVYEFENAAFNTNIGEVSMPFRTQFGYHVVKVFDKHKSRGEVTAGHIMISNKQTDTLINPEERLQEIYKLIKQGENFESLAKQFSDDKSSASKGGKLAPFKGGQLSSVEFENVAFDLEEPNEISEPFKTDYGWHIVKLYSKEPVAPFEDLKYELENNVKRDSRSKLINVSLLNKLKKQYNVLSVIPEQAYFVSILNDNFYRRSWQIPEDIKKDKPFIKIGDKQLTHGDFVNQLRNKQKTTTQKKPFADIVNEAYADFVNKNVLIYHEENLENENEEFAQILSEYREGLLLFDLMETKIWNAVKKDSLGIQNYYNNNMESYKWESRIDAIVATSTKEEDIKEVKKMLGNSDDLESIKKILNSDNAQKVIFTSGIMTADHQALPKDFNFEKGVSKIYYHNDAYQVIKVNKVLPEAQKTIEEARGAIISDYQNEVEKNWIGELKNKYRVDINADVLSKIKSKIYN